MPTPQPAILAPVPAHAAFLFFDRRPGVSADAALGRIAALTPDERLLVGLGPALLAELGHAVPGLRPMPELPRNPSTPTELLLRISGDDPGEVLHRERPLLAALSAFEVIDRVDAFRYGRGRDLTGYEDGTENPTGEDAAAAALASDGSSVVAVQRWLHDLYAFDRMSKPDQDAAIGRERESNDELEDAPDSAHVKRTAQEDFDPEAFVVRRSMPWSDARGAGLVFVAFGATLDPFEAQLRRMNGLDDGIVDALYAFTRPVFGATFWCPPLAGGRPALGIS